jgi:hypothetical protein
MFDESCERLGSCGERFHLVVGHLGEVRAERGASARATVSASENTKRL